MKKREEVIRELEKELDPSLVKQREGRGGTTLSYLEGHVVISQLNRIFGYDGWEYEVLEHSLVTKFATTKDGKEYANVGYMARVRLKVRIGDRTIVREDVGFCGVTDPHPLHAYENAIKGAVTDALKRCARSFGSQFGNDLYGKEERENRENGEVEKGYPQRGISEKQKGFIARLLKEKGIEEEKLREWLSETYGKKSVEELSREEASSVINFLKSEKATTLKESYEDDDLDALTF